MSGTNSGIIDPLVSKRPGKNLFFFTQFQVFRIVLDFWKKKIGLLENFGFLKKIGVFAEILDFSDFFVIVLFLCDFLDFSVIFLDFSNVLSHHCTVTRVTRPEHLKGVNDVIKQARFFIGPRCPWGPIYGSGSLSQTH